MGLNQLYRPIEEELAKVEETLGESLSESKNESIREVNSFLLESPGKRIRPALVILCAKSALNEKPESKSRIVTKIASAIELIHMASLIHDDVIDHANLRHNKPSVNSMWGNDVAIALGDYLYSQAFKLIASSRNTEVLTCLAKAMSAMCEGELSQVKDRDNLGLKKRQYLLIVKKKTASLMASCCRVGVASVKGKLIYKEALTNYGLNFGIAFQVMDDYLDLTSTTEELGKPAGLDLARGEFTLPSLFLDEKKREELLKISKKTSEAVPLICRLLEESSALSRTVRFINSYILRAKQNLNLCPESEYRSSLEGLADFVSHKIGPQLKKRICPQLS